MSAARRGGRKRPRWIGYLLGVAALAGLIGAVVHWGESAHLVALVREAEPSWLLLALALQAGTYATEATSWGIALAWGGQRKSLGRLYEYSLVQLFTNQTLPVGGLAGAVVVVDALRADGVPTEVALGAVLVDEVGYLAAYGLALAGALLMVGLHRTLPWPVIAGAGVIGGAGLALGGFLWWVTAKDRQVPPSLRRVGPLARVVARILEADPRLARSLPLYLAVTAVRSVHFALDGLTMWACLRAVGQHVSPLHASAGFVIAELGRSLGIVPGGLGTFEGTALGGMALFGIPVEAALAAALLFRALSWLLPMAPGLIAARAIARR